MNGQRIGTMDSLSLEDWVKILKNRGSAFEAEAQEREIGNPVIFRVDRFLRELRSELFDAAVVSLGLFHKQEGSHSDLPADTLKLDVVITFLADTGNRPENWKTISARAVTNPVRMKRLYDGHWHLHLLPESIQSSLAVDAIFVTCFLLYFLRNFPSGPLSPLMKPATNEIFSKQHKRINMMLFKDVLKLENQIPLELIRNVIAIIFQSRAPDLTNDVCLIRANEMLETICSHTVRTLSKRLPSFHLPTTSAVDRQAVPVKLHECQHLLHCLAQAVWNGAEAPTKLKTVSQATWRASIARNCYEALMQQIKTLHPFRSCVFRNHKYQQVKVPRLLQYLPTANKLQKYGIEFQGQKEFLPKFKKHAFFPWKATLFLPKIAVIDDGTDEQWRNLLAFEDAYKNEHERERYFMSYLQFMDELINTEEDVSVLCSGRNPVIRWNGLGDDKAVADLFRSVTKNHIITHSERWSAVKNELVQYHNATWRKTWFAFANTYLQSPWLVIFIAAALVVVSFLQTVYAMIS